MEFYLAKPELIRMTANKFFLNPGDLLRPHEVHGAYGKTLVGLHPNIIQVLAHHHSEFKSQLGLEFGV